MFEELPLYTRAIARHLIESHNVTPMLIEFAASMEYSTPEEWEKYELVRVIGGGNPEACAAVYEEALPFLEELLK